MGGRVPIRSRPRSLRRRWTGSIGGWKRLLARWRRHCHSRGLSDLSLTSGWSDVSAGDSVVRRRAMRGATAYVRFLVWEEAQGSWLVARVLCPQSPGDQSPGRKSPWHVVGFRAAGAQVLSMLCCAIGWSVGCSSVVDVVQYIRQQASSRSNPYPSELTARLFLVNMTACWESMRMVGSAEEHLQ